MNYIIRSLALFFIITFSGQAYANKDVLINIIEPIEFSNRIQGEITQNEIAALYELPVSMGGNKAHGVELTNSENETLRKTVSTCTQYKAHKDKGWLAMTTYDLSMESFFKSTCGRLDILSGAKTSKSGRFGTTPYHMDQPKLYPAGFLDQITTAGGTLCEGAETLDKCAEQRNGKVTLESGRLVFSDKHFEAFFTPSMKADINGDGSEDMIFDYGYYVKEGTFRSYGQICLEWPEGQKEISVIDCGID